MDIELINNTITSGRHCLIYTSMVDRFDCIDEISNAQLMAIIVPDLETLKRKIEIADTIINITACFLLMTNEEEITDSEVLEHCEIFRYGDN